TFTGPIAESAGARALICVPLTKARGAGLPLMATEIPFSVVGSTPSMTVLSQVAESLAKWSPKMERNEPDWIVEPYPAALTIPFALTAGAGPAMAGGTRM